MSLSSSSASWHGLLLLLLRLDLEPPAGADLKRNLLVLVLDGACLCWSFRSASPATELGAAAAPVAVAMGSSRDGLRAPRWLRGSEGAAVLL
ncbi:hypothetical protein B0T24DRAFT_614144 [Lasiosphaeria ovina]|uniref:Secreted protein n=1 Tax=Lasiosphaeria ovina TaxID=92902 RepID=A0AAE0TTW2_9PEZI|nr:hypothetical protein B0T24DRAFT_614144 [Lasiosphaeria ovina]